jgi:hypothetical protein
VKQYSEGFRSRIVGRMVGPYAMSADAVSREIGVPQPVLSSCLRMARSVDAMSQSLKRKSKQRSGPALRSCAWCSRLAISLAPTSMHF